MLSPKETRPASPDDAAVSNHSHVTKDKSREEPLAAASLDLPVVVENETDVSEA